MPHPGPQTAFHRNSAYELLFGGAKGPGKTESLLRESLRQCHLPRYRAILFRRTYPQLGEIIDRSFKYFLSLESKPKYSDKDMQLKLPAWTFPSGAKVCFGSCQHEKDKYNYQGKEFQFQGFDQLEQFTESQYLYLFAQNRSSDPNVKRYVRATANPGGVGHAWVKRRFIEPLMDPVNKKKIQIKYFKRVNDDDIEVSPDDPHGKSRSFIFSNLFDNPSLQDDYIATLKQLSDQDQRAFIDGDWEAFKGQFFKMWRNSIHVQRKPVNPAFKKFLSLDYGYGKPSSVGWWQIDYDGNLHRYRELYKEQLTYEQLARAVQERTPDEEHLDYCVADPAIWGDKSHHKEGYEGESGAETIRNIWGSFCALLPADNDRLIGWGRMRIELTPTDGVSALTCDPSCKDSIRTIPGLVHDELRPEDLDTDGEDHAADEWRYALMSRPSKTPALQKDKAPYRSYAQIEQELELDKQMEDANPWMSVDSQI